MQNRILATVVYIITIVLTLVFAFTVSLQPPNMTTV